MNCYDCNNIINDDNKLICRICTESINEYSGESYCVDCVDFESNNSSVRDFTELFQNHIYFVCVVLCDDCFNNILQVENEELMYTILCNIVERYEIEDERFEDDDSINSIDNNYINDNGNIIVYI